jgi:hypothetical protein
VDVAPEGGGAVVGGDVDGGGAIATFFALSVGDVLNVANNARPIIVARMTGTTRRIIVSG